MLNWKHLIYLLWAVGLSSCSPTETRDASALFSEMPPDSTGIHFSNDLTFDQEFNIYTYRNFYNGGGVALGDVNNDGLPDIYFTGNLVSNKLYLNKGNFQFEDITEKAGVSGTQSWSTGVSMADVNGDGYLDIYVCNSGNIKGGLRKSNELFINNGDLTFTERAKEYGVDDQGYSTHAAFFDYDRDGDLDLYVLNNSYQAIGSFNLRKNERSKRDLLGGDKLLRNDGDRFNDVSNQAGIYGSVIGFGLGVSVGDMNNDHWPDIFVSNDFFERDYLYINNQNGTFTESLPSQMNSISGASMGADLADINNDGWTDLFVTEMLPRENARLKTVTTFEDWNRYQYNVSNDYHHQFTRNMLHLNNGNNTFSEVGRLAGVEATDWSWGALMFDMDNDGLKDIFVANGIYQDLTNQDFLQFASNEEFVKSVVEKNVVDYKKLTEIIPSTPIANFAFKNGGDMKFEDHAERWGLGKPAFSNGAAYGDLDNDGDLDLVVNNVNMPCFVYRNESNKLFPKNRFIKFNLKGSGKNTYAVGTRITAEMTNGEKIVVEQMPIRGFESTVDARPHLGLGQENIIKRLTIMWPNGKTHVLDSVASNQTLTLRESEGLVRTVKSEVQPVAMRPLFTPVPAQESIEFFHRENNFVDFDRDQLIYHMLSTEGPKMTRGDINGDGLDDVFIGGAKDQPGAILVQTSRGNFVQKTSVALEGDKLSEDAGSLFFDADGDGDLDLYVCSGGNEFPPTSSALADRLYFNDGAGEFIRSPQLLPAKNFESTSAVAASDFDADGDLDLFVGVRLRPFSYGHPVNGYILLNDGKGQFTDITPQVAPELLKLGMITDALWADIDADNDDDLLVVGEYMPVSLFVNEGGKLLVSRQAGLQKTHGWWNTIEAADLDNDGDPDFVLGNHGLNSKFKGSADKPVCMYVNDFDHNGTTEHIICMAQGTTYYPTLLRHDLVAQIPSLKKKYLKYESFKNETLTDIFTQQELAGALKLDAFEMRSAVLLNDGEGGLTMKPLPTAAQYAPVYGIEVLDVDGDKFSDLILGGNLYGVKPEAGRYDASFGLCLKGNGDGTFLPVPNAFSGLKLHGEVRDIVSVIRKDKVHLVVSRNNNSVVVYSTDRTK